MPKQIAIGFDHSHNNKLTIENNAFTDFIRYLFDSDFKLGKIEAGINKKKLIPYDLFIIGVPTLGPDLDSDEIGDLVNYVKDGGSILVVNDDGGDYKNKNNLSKLTENFGIVFNPDMLFDNKYFSRDSSHPLIKDFRSHFITRNVSTIIHSSGCTLTIDKSVEDDNIDVQAIAYSSENTSWHRVFKVDEWIDESKQNLPIIGVAHFGLGKVVAIGNLSLLSSLNEYYGIRALDNYKIIVNIISWLLNKATSKGEQLAKPIYLTVPIEQDLYYWIKELLNDGKWNRIEEIVNFALKNIKNSLKKQSITENNTN